MRISAPGIFRRSQMPVMVTLAAVFALHAPTVLASASKQKVWNESEIVKALDIRPRSKGTGLEFTTSEGLVCGVAAVLKTGGAVRLYESAGDVVASNPSKTAGIKIVASQARDCLEAAESMLADLR